jgi:hypothetical protein
MTRRVKTMAPAVLAMSLAGCFLKAPLDVAPQGPLDPRILGSWRCLEVHPRPTAEAGTIVVTAAREGFATVAIDDERYEIHPSLVGTETVLNVRDPKDGSWTFARYSFLRPDVVGVRVLDDSKVKSTEALRAALRSDVEKPFQDWLVCLRAQEPQENR